MGNGGSESVGMWQSRFFYSLLHKLVEILDTDELFSLSLRGRVNPSCGDVKNSISYRFAPMEWERLLCDTSDFESARRL